MSQSQTADQPTSRYGSDIEHIKSQTIKIEQPDFSSAARCLLSQKGYQ